jgi:hypothetical protein
MKSEFIPFTHPLARSAKTNDPFKLLLHNPQKSQSQNLNVPPNPGQPTHTDNTDQQNTPQVHIEKNGDIIQKIIITCICGKKFEIECKY